MEWEWRSECERAACLSFLIYAFTPNEALTERYLQNRLESYPKTLQKRINGVRGESGFLEISELLSDAYSDLDPKDSQDAARIDAAVQFVVQ